MRSRRTCQRQGCLGQGKVMLAAVTSNSQSSEVCCNKGLLPVHCLAPCGCRGHSQSWGNRLPMSRDPGPSAWEPSIGSLHPAGKKKRDWGEWCSRFRDRLGRAHLTPAHISLVRTQSPGLSWTLGEGPGNAEPCSRGVAENSQARPSARRGSGGTGAPGAGEPPPGLAAWFQVGWEADGGHKDKGQAAVRWGHRNGQIRRLGSTQRRFVSLFTSQDNRVLLHALTWGSGVSTLWLCCPVGAWDLEGKKKMEGSVWESPGPGMHAGSPLPLPSH